MNCKSCNTPLTKSAKYCSNCGGKVIEGKLSLKGTWHEFISPFLSWDNHFWKTLKHLATQPKSVADAYISGARKKYFQPFALLILYATIALFVGKIVLYETNVDTIYNSVYDNNSEQNNTETVRLNDVKENKSHTLNQKDFAAKFTNFFTDYSNFITLLSIPLFALISFLVFRKQGHNYAEHLIFNSYAQSFTGFIALIFSACSPYFMNNFLLIGVILSFLPYLIMYIYYNYFFNSLYQLSLKSMLLKNIKFWAFLLLASTLASVLVLSLGFLFAYLHNV